MKRLLTHLVLTIILIAVGSTHCHAVSVDVTVTTPGTLEQAILAQATDLNDVTSIKISGTLNDADHDIIQNSLPNLEEIDMGEVDMAEMKYYFYGRSKLTKIVLPNNLTTIGTYTFYHCSSLTSITIPVGVTSISGEAFLGCTKLNKVIAPDLDAWCAISFQGYSCNPLYYAHHLFIDENTEILDFTFPEGMTSIGNCTLCGCSSLQSITIPESVTSIGNLAFYDCSSLTSITIPDGVTSIGSSVFSGCSSLTSVNIPEGVTSIGGFAFYGCSSLTTITIPEDVTSIGASAFKGCSSLTSVNIPEGVTSIGGNAFSGCSSIKSIIIPEGVKKILDNTFSGCSKLTQINIPDGVTSIGYSAFSSCTSLTSINIPDGVTSIEYSAFSHCKSLTSINIPESVTSIEPLTFYDCSKLTQIYIPDGVTSIGAQAFSGCSKLTKINIPEGVTSIGESAFSTCISLTSINIPERVTSISQSVFSHCSSLTSINIPEGVTSIGKNAFFYCTGLTSINIPEGVTSIGQSAFSYCTGLTSINIPEGVTSIGNSAFSNCTSLMEVTIPEGVTSIDQSVFSYCTNLTSINIPEGVTSIGKNAFFYCTSLASFYCMSDTPPTCATDVFHDVPTSTCILYVPEGSEDAYSATSPWSSFTNIKPFVSSSITDEEWAILGIIREELVANGWATPWDMSKGKAFAGSLKGLTLQNKHVVVLDLSENQLSGGVATSMFQLPYLETLNLSNNNLSGDVASGIPNAMESQSAALATLKTINLSHNQLTGNIGLLASQFPALESLDVSYNSLTDVSPAISAKVTTVNLGNQTLGQSLSLDLTQSSYEGFFTTLPTILTYDPATQGYRNGLNLLCTTGNVTNYYINSSTDWGAVFSYNHNSDEWSIPQVSRQYAYHGDNGAQLQAMLLDGNMQETGTTLGLKLQFDIGDSNFDGEVDVTDLQATINEVMETHERTPFNFTAADINHDEDLNVLDVIGEVNILMDAEPAAVPHAYRTEAGATPTYAAMVYVADGQLCVHSEVPVAAFDIRVTHAALQSLSAALGQNGITCSVTERGDGFHVIGYSLGGGLLPVGETPIATLSGASATVTSAVLADEQAAKVATACNMSPTSIFTLARQRVDIRPSCQGFAVISSEDDIVSWRVTTTDGRLVGQGELPVRSSVASHIALPRHGMFIVTVQTAQESVTQKVSNMR